MTGVDPASRRPAGALEGEVLGVLAELGRATPGDVQAALGDSLAYTTVMTTLNRLHSKGLATRQKLGRAYAYTPAVRHDEHTAEQMRALLDRGNRQAVLASFVGGLSAADETLLHQLLDEGGPSPSGAR